MNKLLEFFKPDTEYIEIIKEKHILVNDDIADMTVSDLKFALDILMQMEPHMKHRICANHEIEDVGRIYHGYQVTVEAIIELIGYKTDETIGQTD